MNCSIHRDVEASSRCFNCGALICEECSVDSRGRVLCQQCGEEDRNQASKGKVKIKKSKSIENHYKTYNRFLAFIFSLIPGAGQMYLGLMERGLILITLVIFLIVVSFTTYEAEIFMPFAIMIWLYSFFDCLNIRRKIDRQEEIEDELIYGLDIRKYNSFFSFIFSLIPGAGQMYLGLMKRGLQLIVLAGLIMVLSIISNMANVFMPFVIIVWIYSFFDCLNVKRKMDTGEAVEDKLIYNINILDIKELNLNYKHTGIGLIVIGGLGILTRGYDDLLYYMREYDLDHIYRILRLIGNVSFPALLIIVGIILLRKARKESKKSTNKS